MIDRKKDELLKFVDLVDFRIVEFSKNKKVKNKEICVKHGGLFDIPPMTVSMEEYLLSL